MGERLARHMTSTFFSISSLSDMPTISTDRPHQSGTLLGIAQMGRSVCRTMALVWVSKQCDLIIHQHILQGLGTHLPYYYHMTSEQSQLWVHTGFTQATISIQEIHLVCTSFDWYMVTGITATMETKLRPKECIAGCFQSLMQTIVWVDSQPARKWYWKNTSHHLNNNSYSLFHYVLARVKKFKTRCNHYLSACLNTSKVPWTSLNLELLV